MGALLIRRRRPLGEPPAAHDSPPGVDLIRGTVGAGRFALALAGLGIRLDDVVQVVIDADLPLDDLKAVDLGRRFSLVVLGSHLVNLPDEGSRGAFLGVARRHLADRDADGPPTAAVIEHHPLDWASTAASTPATAGGSQPGMVDVRRDPPFVSAVSVYDVGGRVVRQPFRARVLSEAELAAALEAVGMSVVRRLSPTWLMATSAG